jgi:mannose/cellobiose epimerase-like protein (N-acyl-D-glucosamine 2-epimerase family)
MPNHLDFTFSDTVTGRVARYDPAGRILAIDTLDGRRYDVEVPDDTPAELLRNLDEPYRPARGGPADLLLPGRFVVLRAIFYPVPPRLAGSPQAVVVARHLLVVGQEPDAYRFEEQGWWVDQLRSIATFYHHAQFGDSPVDYREYRTELRLGGDKTTSHVQETDTISRLVYGMASAYLLTGRPEYLDVAEKGVRYLREHMRFVDLDEDIVYWYHGIHVDGETERKIFTSEFSDDYDAIPMYEQIYALAGLTQTYRITADPSIKSDIDATLRLFRRFFRDDVHGGYFSHIDPVHMRPDHDSLGPNRARKNWNSIGDHAPAYLINLYLATGDASYAEMLEDTFDTIVERFPDTKNSPFVQERFLRDWTADDTHGWQQNRAVVGHNLKISWNLTRMHALRPKPEYLDLAVEIAERMPSVGSDRQRGGWYDVLERVRRDDLPRHEFSWHDRKAWWQQEQAILAYLILAGTTGRVDLLDEARAAQAFYNAFFLDHDEGAVYFNVLADGSPYALGTERLKGSHSMSMYHSAELCFLGEVYADLLVHGRDLRLFFRPVPDDLPGGVLRVSPDLLPPGAVQLDEVEVDGVRWQRFDRHALTVDLGPGREPVQVRVTLTAAPAESWRNR